MKNLRSLVMLMVVLGSSFAAQAANYVFSFSGVGSDGRTVSFQYTSGSAIATSTVAGEAQASCAPACDEIGFFPNAQLGYDLLVFNLKNTSGAPTSFPFYFPYGAFANPGTYSTISQAGVQNSGTLTVQTTGMPSITSPGALPNGVVGTVYSATFTAGGGTGPYVFTADSAALPAGLSLTTGGVLSGTPATAASYNFAVKVTDSTGAFSTRSYSVNVAAGVNIATQTLPNGSTGALYNQTLAAVGGTPAYTFTILTGSLPPGLTLSPAGTISGTPTSGGAFSFTVRVSDSTAATASKGFTISIANQVSITTASPLPSASVNTMYTLSLGAIGGTPAYTWTVVSGTLPTGLTLSSAGTLAGNPTASGNYNFTLQATDAAGATSSRAYTMYVGTGVAIQTLSVPTAVVGAPYSKTMAATGGTAPYTWTVAGGALPSGLTMTPGGVLSGTPTTAGAYVFTVVVADSASSSTFTNITLLVANAITVTTGTTLPAGTPGVAYSQNLSATGGTGGYTWTVTSGSFPPGLSLSSQGVISGAPTTGGAYNFVVRVTDNASGVGMQSFNLTVAAALVISTPAQLPSASVGVQYAQTFSATGGSAPYVWTVASGSVPQGLSLSINGVLSGTATTGGSYSFVVRVTDGTGVSTVQTFAITVGSGLAITTTALLPSGVPGFPYSQTFVAVGGTPPYSWTVVGGSVPAGMNLSVNGLLSGTPTAAGSSTFQVRVTDNTGANTTQTFTLVVGSGLTITTPTTLATGVVGQVYSQTLAAAGGTTPYFWTLAGGSVPPGLNLSTAGVLSGTPATQGSYLFIARVADSVGTQVTQTFSLTISTGLSITTGTTLPNGAVSVAYSQALAASGGVAPYTWSLASGTLAPGITVGTNGTLAGTPTSAGMYLFTLRVNDSTGATATATFTLTIGSGIAITTAALPNGAIGVAYTQVLAASGGTAPYVFGLLSGTLPTGLSLANNGTISGTPSVVGQYTFTVRASDATSAYADKSFTVTVNPGINITTTSPLPAGSFGLVYFQTLAATGGVAPYSWSVTAGNLPPGITLNSAGTVQGTPTSGGTYTFTVKVIDAVTTSATASFTITVNSGITITTPSPLPEANVGSNYFLTFGASGGAGPYTWTVFSGSLPPGLALSTSGALTGVPAVAGSFSFVVRLVDAQQISTQAAFNLTVNSGNVYPRSGVISQLASGGGWKTTLTLINPNTAQATVRVNLYGDDGTPLQLPLAISQAGGTVSTVAAVVDRTIPAGGTLIIETDAAVSTTSVGWADVRATLTVSGFAIFRQRHTSGVDSEGTSPLENRLQTSVLVPMDNLTGYSTGVALVNLSAETLASVTAIMRDENGTEIARDTISIPANGHTSFSLPARFAVLAGRRGVVEFQSSTAAGVTGLGLRFNPTLSFTSVPVIVR